ncbi:putative autophagy-related protein 17 [Coleophoma cylindrospora]|uniref:Autophagy-related protein 17 n=1 Tax=Coleophoma cylindrospora TaxID=1849047 RepID=A0A3D8QDG7_9HELO|nr:putative autophagy-related protein 17 [Coleophoma cylindrospora]
MSSSPVGREPSSSQASLSPAASPSQSMSGQDIPLQTLVTYLLASKRSLSSINTVWRANEIVQSARIALEESVVLSARTGFLRSGISEQVQILRRVRGGIENVYKEGQKDFKTVIRTLDAANARLESTMDTLRSTIVEAAFRPPHEDPRNLLDFVHEQGVESMQDALKASIKEAQEAQTDFDTSILAFDDDLRALKSAMSHPKQPTSQSQSELLSSETQIPTHLHDLEIHAQEMASLLDSLVQHFDLCVNAIRHTEGGYAAVRHAASHPPPGAEPVSVSGVMNTESESVHEAPISEEERLEMLAVLENDSNEVEDVVLELRDRAADMESKHESILEQVATLQAAYRATTNAYSSLEVVSSHLPSYIIASQEFRYRWEEIKDGMRAQMEELEGMRIFYENYHSSYDGLILEVDRRKQSEEKVKSILKKAMEQVKKVHDADMMERSAFRDEVGDFLPMDLYPGLTDQPPRWGVQVLEKSGELDAASGAGSTPNLPSAVVEAADQRDRERRRLGQR